MPHRSGRSPRLPFTNSDFGSDVELVSNVSEDKSSTREHKARKKDGRLNKVPDLSVITNFTKSSSRAAGSFASQPSNEDTILSRRKRSKERQQKGSPRKPQKQTTVRASDLSQSDRELVIGIEEIGPVAESRGNYQKQGLIIEHNPDNAPKSANPEIVITPAGLDVPWRQNDVYLGLPGSDKNGKDNRPRSSVYSQATHAPGLKGYSPDSQAPPVPEIPEEMVKHGEKSEKQDFEYLSPLPSSQFSASRRLSDVSIATKRRSQGWWNTIVTPFLDRSNSTKTNQFATPKIPQRFESIRETKSEDGGDRKHRETGHTSVWFDKNRGTLAFFNDNDSDKHDSVPPLPSATVVSPDYEEPTPLGLAAEYYEASYHDLNSVEPFYQCHNHICSYGSSNVQRHIMITSPRDVGYPMTEGNLRALGSSEVRGHTNIGVAVENRSSGSSMTSFATRTDLSDDVDNDRSPTEIDDEADKASVVKGTRSLGHVSEIQQEPARSSQVGISRSVPGAAAPSAKAPVPSEAVAPLTRGVAMSSHRGSVQSSHARPLSSPGAMDSPLQPLPVASRREPSPAPRGIPLSPPKQRRMSSPVEVMPPITGPVSSSRGPATPPPQTHNRGLVLTSPPSPAPSPTPGPNPSAVAPVAAPSPAPNPTLAPVPAPMPAANPTPAPIAISTPNPGPGPAPATFTTISDRGALPPPPPPPISQNTSRAPSPAPAPVPAPVPVPGPASTRPSFAESRSYITNTPPPGPAHTSLQTKALGSHPTGGAGSTETLVRSNSQRSRSLTRVDEDQPKKPSLMSRAKDIFKKLSESRKSASGAGGVSEKDGSEQGQAKSSKVSDPKRKKKRLCFWITTAALLGLVVLIIVLVLTLRTARGDMPIQTSWLNLTNYPPIPTGVSTIAQPEVEREAGCVSPQTMWSCSVPKEDQEAIKPNKPDQPNFRLEIRFQNGTNLTNSSDVTKRSIHHPHSMSAIGYLQDHALAVRDFTDSLFQPSPAPPSLEDQEFIGNTTDGNEEPLGGEDTPFYISFIPANKVSSSKRSLHPRQDDEDSTTSESTSTTTSFPTLQAAVPSPAVQPDGGAAPANLQPFPTAQPLRLYNRGRPDEHYGFYIYYDRSIFLRSASVDNITEIGEIPADMDGGAEKESASVRCTWPQTRFLVQIWTNTGVGTGRGAQGGDGGGVTLLGTSNGTKTSSGKDGDAKTKVEDSSANDFAQPGSFPYPVTITLDRHGGAVTEKNLYCYGMDVRGRIEEKEAKFQRENRTAGGTLVNPALNIFEKLNITKEEGGPGGIDGGTGGCSCVYRNFRQG